MSTTLRTTRPRKTHCIAGHERAPANLYPDGRCRPCHLRRQAVYDAKRPKAPPRERGPSLKARVMAASAAELRERAWPLRIYWAPGSSFSERWAVDCTPGATSPVSRNRLLDWSRRGWIVRTREDRRGPRGLWETYDLTDAGREALAS